MIVYCKKCHREAYRTIEEDGNIKVIQNGVTMFTFNRKSHINIDIACPNGHQILLKIGEENEVSSKA